MWMDCFGTFKIPDKLIVKTKDALFSDIDKAVAEAKKDPNCKRIIVDSLDNAVCSGWAESYPRKES